MDRRTYLKMQTASLVWLGSGAGTVLAAGEALAAPTPDVAVVKGDPAAATRAAVELLGGMGRFVKKGQRVLVKPNMSFARDVDSATNTHPEVVRAVCALCREAGASAIMVRDHALHDPAKALELSGILDACDSFESGICRQMMQARHYVDTTFARGSAMRANAVMRDVLEADVIISVPVAKSHGGAGVSLSLKGQMGLVYDRGAMHSRYPLDTAIVDLNSQLKAGLVIIDASRVLTSGGPGGPGKVIQPREIIASADPVAADATAVASYEWYGRRFEPRQVNHIRLAHERGLGRMDIDKLTTRRLVL